MKRILTLLSILVQIQIAIFSWSNAHAEGSRMNGFDAHGRGFFKEYVNTDPRFGTIRIPFIPNEGQLHEDVAFSCRTFGGPVFITREGSIVYALAITGGRGTSPAVVLQEECIDGRINSIEGKHPGRTRMSFFKGNDPSKWQSDIQTFEVIDCGEIYDGITLSIKAYGNNIEKLFHINPGSHPEDINIQVKGAMELQVTATGALELKTGHGIITFSRPIAYQETGGLRKDVHVSYRTQGNRYGFTVGDYDRSQPLIIDPLLASTFIGGSGDEGWQYSGAIDVVSSHDGSIYVAGMTASQDFPATPGAYQDSLVQISSDIFVAKLNSDLSQLLAATYLGGWSAEEEPKMALGADGHVFIIGCTSSSNFPTLVNSYDTSRDGRWDVFISKFDADLTTLLGSTYLGGSSDERMVAMALDEDDHVFVTGYTSNNSFPTTPEAYDQDYNGGDTDFFISKLNSDLSTLMASTFLGGIYHEQWPSIGIDPSAHVIIGASTGSYDYPTTVGAYDTDFNGPHAYDYLNFDKCVSKLDNDLTTLLSSTFIGTDGFDGGSLLGIDNDGNIYVGGHTESVEYPTTPNVYDEDHNGENEYFLSKLDGDLTTLLASTFLTADDESFSYITDIAFDVENNVYIAGTAFDQNFSTTMDPFDETYNGGWNDVILRKFNSDLTELTYSTFLGGSDYDGDAGLAMTENGDIYIVGYTASPDFPTRQEGYDTSHNGEKDCFVARMNIDAGQFTRRQEGVEVNDGGFSHGVSWIDYDNDSFLDLFITSWDYNMAEGDVNCLYHNNGDGTYEKVTAGPVANDENALASTWGDYDNDGDIDAYVLDAGGINYFYTNSGDGTFTKVTDSPVTEKSEFSMGAMWIDYDNDGRLDLFVVNHRPPSVPSGVENDLYRNQQNGFARQDNGDIGLIEDEGNSAAWGDYDGDGDLDLFLTRNDNLSLLFENDGDGTFTRITGGVIISENTHAGNWADYDNDGDLDLVASYDYPGPMQLYRNEGNGNFQTVTDQDVVNDVGYWVGGYWGDYDNDGDLDLFITGMYYYGPHVNRLYENRGVLGFSSVTTGDIANDAESSIAAAWGDHDRDGDLDLFVTNTSGEHNTLYVNNGNSNHWISVTCVGTVSNRSAVGTRVRLKAVIGEVPVWQLREVASQSGYISQSSFDVHFGLGDAQFIDSLRVEWPSGMIDMLTNIEVDQFLTITEGEYGDLDGDGVVDINDNCPDLFNPHQEDSDTDGIGDICDNCAQEGNPNQADADEDSIGDLCDHCTDIDGDGYGDPGYPANTCEEDNCPAAYNPDQAEVESGDIDCSGDINVLDVLAVVNHILGTFTLVGAPSERADCNGDAHVNVLDALSIVNIILGIIPQCPGGDSAPVVTPEVIAFCQSLKSHLTPEHYGRFMALVKEVRLPEQFNLHQNYPNPFNTTTSIAFTVPHACSFKLSIYNVTGQCVKKLIEGETMTGRRVVKWDGRDEQGVILSSGVYFCHLAAEDVTISMKMLLLK